MRFPEIPCSRRHSSAKVVIGDLDAAGAQRIVAEIQSHGGYALKSSCEAQGNDLTSLYQPGGIIEVQRDDMGGSNSYVRAGHLAVWSRRHRREFSYPKYLVPARLDYIGAQRWCIGDRCI